MSKAILAPDSGVCDGNICFLNTEGADFRSLARAQRLRGDSDSRARQLTPRLIAVDRDITLWYVSSVKAKHRKTLEAIYRHPVSGTIKWSDIEALLGAVGAEIDERAGSRVAVILEGQVHVFHRPHPSPETDKGAVRDVRDMLREAGIQP